MSQSDQSGKSSRVKVSDEENRSQKATIQRIQSFRDDIAQYQLAFANNELSREVPEENQHRSYHLLAKGFLQLLRPYLEDDSASSSNYYWDEIDLGEFTIDPPAVVRQPTRHEMGRALKSGDLNTISRADPRNAVEPKRYSCIGLRDFAASQPEWTVEWTVMFGPEVSATDLRAEINDRSVTVPPRSHRNEPISIQKKARVPRPMIDNAITAMENFVREIGMDVEMVGDPYDGDGGPGI
jgi:hypothetical protein